MPVARTQLVSNHKANVICLRGGECQKRQKKAAKYFLSYSFFFFNMVNVTAYIYYHVFVPDSAHTLSHLILTVDWVLCSIPFPDE